MQRSADEMSMRLKLTSCAAAIAAATATAPASAADFRTPNRAAYCDYVPRGEIIEGGVQNTRAFLFCWTPNDSFNVVMAGRGGVRKGYSQQTENGVPVDRTLRFGSTWRRGAFVCKSRTTGLTCRNAFDHGWQLGRFVGYSIF